MKELINRFREDNSGSVLILFIVLIPLIITVLILATDLTESQSFYGNNQNAVDTSSLATNNFLFKLKLEQKGKPEYANGAWKDYRPSKAEITAYAQSIYETSLMQQETQYELEKFNVRYNDRFNDKYTVAIESCIITENEISLLPETQRICNESSSEISFEEKLINTEIAFSLDMSQSMKGGKIAGLKSAVDSIVDKYFISEKEAEKNNVQMSVVPYTSLTHIHPYDKNLVNRSQTGPNNSVGTKKPGHRVASFVLDTDDINWYENPVNGNEFRKFKPYWSIDFRHEIDINTKDTNTQCNKKIPVEPNFLCDPPLVEKTVIEKAEYTKKIPKDKEEKFEDGRNRTAKERADDKEADLRAKMAPAGEIVGVNRKGAKTVAWKTCGNPENTGQKYEVPLKYNFEVKMACYAITDGGTYSSMQSINVQPLTHNTALVKDQVSQLQHHIDNVANSVRNGNSHILKPFQTSGVQGIFTAWMTLAPGWQDKWSDRSLMEKFHGYSVTDRSRLPSKNDSKAKYIIHVTDGVDNAQGLKNDSFYTIDEQDLELDNQKFKLGKDNSRHIRNYKRTCARIKQNGIKLFFIYYGSGMPGWMNKTGCIEPGATNVAQNVSPATLTNVLDTFFQSILTNVTNNRLIK